LVRKYYARVPRREELLDQAVLTFARAGHRLLDAGCGDQIPLLLKYGSKVTLAVGIDLVPPSVERIGRSAVIRGDLASPPFQEEAFDLVVSHSVFEHLEHPERVFRELNRVLRPHGKLIFTTPNRYFYSCLIAGVIPFALKSFYMRRVFGEDGYDHFPVYYRANPVRALRRLAKDSGFTLQRLQAIRHWPFYLMFSPLLFRVGMLYASGSTWCARPRRPTRSC
jgi:SAM-dependent methyltransferase